MNRTLARLATLGGLAWAALLATPAAEAQAFVQGESTLTVTEPVEVPGAVLQPGTYVLKVVDTESDRNIVQVTNPAGTKVYALTIATPHVGSAPPRGSEFVYFERGDGTGPRVLRTWFANGDRFGQDFVYPKGRAQLLAALAREAVPAHEAPATVSSEGLKKVPVAPVQPPPSAPAKVTAEQAPAPARPGEAATKVATRRMPRTASPFPLVASAGLLALTAAAGLRAARLGRT